MIRVMVVDDHPTMRAGLAQLLATTPDLEVVAVAADGAQALVLDVEHAADVVLMDVSMPGIDGIETTRRLVAARPAANVVMLTSFAEHDRVLAALDAGAVGYLLKDAEPDELVRGVRAASAGEAPLSPRAANALLANRRRSGGDAAVGQLTQREREVLALVAEGLANKAVARRLGISEKTVKAHLTSVYGTLGVSDRTQAALWARRNLAGEAEGGAGGGT